MSSFPHGSSPFDANNGDTAPAAPANRPFAGAVDPSRFTKREHDILELLARGLPNREIGAQLGISGITVKNHLYRVFTKLDVHTRTEAVVKWLGR